MSSDLRLQCSCSHELFDEPVSINGISPNYHSDLRYQCDGSVDKIQVREFSATEGLSNFLYSRDGFSNWRYRPDTNTMLWNYYGFGGPGTGIASFMDGSTQVLPTPLLLVSYRAKSDKCPRCFATINNQRLTRDLELSARGALSTVSGGIKVRQAVLKALFTANGSNQILTDYGSTLNDLIGQKYDTLAEFRLYDSIQQSIRFLIQEQANQFNIPLNETIAAIKSINVNQDQNDPRRILVQIIVQTADRKDVDVQMTLESN